MPARVHAVVVQAGDELDASVFALDALKDLWPGLAHHLDDFDLGLADNLIGSLVKDLLISAVHADTASSGGHLYTS
jgi:hypothetical protein